MEHLSLVEAEGSTLLVGLSKDALTVWDVSSAALEEQALRHQYHGEQKLSAMYAYVDPTDGKARVAIGGERPGTSGVEMVIT
jgi:hypothetical protein